MPVEGYWVESSVLRIALSNKELELAKDYKSSMASDVAIDYAGFVEHFRKDGYFKDTEPLAWLEENGLKNNEITFLGMKISKIITSFKELLEETEKNLKSDYPAAYNEILEQYKSAPSMLGQAQIRYIANSCTCNPSNHSLGAAIDIRPAINPQITSEDKKYVTFIKYMTGLDLTKSKTDQQVVDAQETFMIKIHGRKTSQFTLKEITDDYKLSQVMPQEFDLLAQLKDKDIEIKDFQTNREDFVAILKAYKNRIIFNDNAKTAIDNMVTYLQSVTTGNTITKKEITDWDKVVSEKQAFLKMVEGCGFPGMSEFIKYFGDENGQLRFKNLLLEKGFGESRIELVKSFHKAHQTISQKYTGVSQDGEWGGSYTYKYDGMHFGLKSSFIKALTNKK